MAQAGAGTGILVTTSSLQEGRAGPVGSLKVEEKGGPLCFGLPKKGAPELLALLTFICLFTLFSDAVVGVAFGGTIFYWTCVGAASGYAGVLLGFLSGLPIAFFRESNPDNLLPRPADSMFCLPPPGGAEKAPTGLQRFGQLLTLVYLVMDACLAGGVLGGALAGGFGLLLEVYYAPTEGEFYAERDIHHIMPSYNWAIFMLVYARNLYKTSTRDADGVGWVHLLRAEMHEWRPKEHLGALF